MNTLRSLKTKFAAHCGELKGDCSHHNRLRLWSAYPSVLYAELRTVAGQDNAREALEQRALEAACVADPRPAGGR